MLVLNFVQEGCDPGVQAAAMEFRGYWKDGKTRYSIPGILEKLVWPAWRGYLRSVPRHLQKLCKGLEIDPLNDPGGRVKKIVREARDGGYLGRMEDRVHFEPTIGTLRFMLEWCQSVKRRQTRSSDRGQLLGRRTGICTWRDKATGQKCREITEYLAYLRGADIGVGKEKGLIQRLNERRCVLHAERSGSSKAAKAIWQKIVKGDKSGEVVRDLGTGWGLCRMCGKLTERDAVEDMHNSGPGLVITSKNLTELSGRFCCEHVSAGRKYHAALLAIAKYDDTRARLQRQSQHYGELKSLHPNPAVNWFENRVVNQLKIRSTSVADPLLKARFNAVYSLGAISAEVPHHEIERELKVFIKALRTQSELFDIRGRSHPVWSALQNLYTSDRSSFNSIAVHALYSDGVDQATIANTLSVDRSFVADLVRELIPIFSPDPDEANLGMAADFLTREAKISETQMEIMYWRSQGQKATEIAKRLRISRQAVSKALMRVPNCLRFDNERQASIQGGKKALWKSSRTLRFNAKGQLEGRTRGRQRSLSKGWN